MNAAAFQDIRRIWRVTTIQRDERTVMLMNWLALIGAVLGLMGAGLAILQHRESPLVLLRVLTGVGAFWLGFIWTMLFVPGSILLNSPANARLVPRQRRRLLQMATGSWALVTLGVTAAMGQWAALPVVGISLIGLALTRAGRTEVAPLFVVGINWPALSRHVLPAAVVEAAASNAGLLTLSVLLLPAGAWALRSLYPAAGDSHLARRGDQVRRAARLERRGLAYPGEGGRLSRWTIARVYPCMLRRALRRPQAGVLLMHALGPVAHWSAWIAGVGGLLLFGAACRLLLEWRGGDALREFVGGPMGAGLAALTVVILFSTAAFSQQLRKHVGEQALLRLTPLTGDAALLNRRLAVQLLANALRNWSMLALVVLLATVLVGGDRETVLRQGALCVLAGQVAAMGLLGDFAGEGGWNVPLTVQAGLLAVVELAVAAGLAKASDTATWAWVAAIAIGVGAWQLRRGWRTMLAAPPAFPAGRIA
jgi:hypothetical protein